MVLQPAIVASGQHRLVIARAARAARAAFREELGRCREEPTLIPRWKGLQKG